MKRPLLVLCIDRDNDLYEKARVSGPLVGREKNMEGAMALSLADPEDPDSNAIYYAIKTHDKMRSEGDTVEIATLTGDKGLGYKADREISSQLDKIVAELNPTSCILISDGASDEEMLPIIKSRLKVDSTKIVFIKQAKELEKTYFVLLEKLRDPYFAKIVLGIPAILILLLSLSSYLHMGWEPVGAIVALYLLMRIFGVEEIVSGVLKEFRFSFERTSWIGYLASIAILMISVFVAYQTVQKDIAQNLSAEKLAADMVGSTVPIIFIGLMLLMVSKSIDSLIEKKKFKITRYILYSAIAALSTFVVVMGSRWVVNMTEPYVDFGTFLGSIAVAMVCGYVATTFVDWYRKELIMELKVEGKEAVSEHGTYIGKIVGIDAKKDKLIIQTIFDKRYALPISAVSTVDEHVVLKAEE